MKNDLNVGCFKKNDVKLNFPDIPSKGLQELLIITQFKSREYLEKYKLIFEDLINRFYVLGEQFDLFSLVNKVDVSNLEVEEYIINLRLFIIQIEMNNNTYNEGFIEFFITSIDNITEKLNGDFTLNKDVLSFIVDKVKYFKSDNPIINQKVNNLIEKYNEIKEDTEKRALLENNVDENKMITTQNKVEKIKIVVSKLKRDELIDALANLELYEEKTKISLIKKGARLYPYETLELCSKDIFMLMKEYKLKNISLPFFAVIERAFLGVRTENSFIGVELSSDIEELNFESDKDSNEYILKYLDNNLSNYDDVLRNYVKFMLFRKQNGKKAFFELIDEVMPIFDDMKNQYIDDLIVTNVEIRSEYFITDFITKYRETIADFRYPIIECIDGKYTYIPKLIKINIFQSYLYIRDMILRYYSYNELDLKYKNFCNMIFDININDDYLNGSKSIKINSENNDFGIYLSKFDVELVLNNKIIENKLTNDELNGLLFNKCKGFMNLFDDFYGTNTYTIRTLELYLEDMLSQFDFNDDDDLKMFLKSVIYKSFKESTDFQKKYVDKKYNDLDDMILNKFKNERNKETNSLFDFFYDLSFENIINYYEQTYK
ncbi:hypothetical protein [Clostridium perfringens]